MKPSKKEPFQKTKSNWPCQNQFVQNDWMVLLTITQKSTFNNILTILFGKKKPFFLVTSDVQNHNTWRWLMLVH